MCSRHDLRPLCQHPMPGQRASPQAPPATRPPMLKAIGSQAALLPARKATRVESQPTWPSIPKRMAMDPRLVSYMPVNPWQVTLTIRPVSTTCTRRSRLSAVPLPPHLQSILLQDARQACTCSYVCRAACFKEPGNSHICSPVPIAHGLQALHATVHQYQHRGPKGSSGVA